MVIVSAPLTIDAVTPGVGDGVGTGDGDGVGDGVGDGDGVGAGVGEGVGEGVDGEEDDPQPSESPNKTVAIVIRRAVMLPPSACFGASRQSCCLGGTSIRVGFGAETRTVETDQLRMPSFAFASRNQLYG